MNFDLGTSHYLICKGTVSRIVPVSCTSYPEGQGRDLDTDCVWVHSEPFTQFYPVWSYVRSSWLGSPTLDPCHWDDSVLFVPLGHSMPARWHPLQASGPELPVPAPPGPGGGASPSVPKIHSAAPSCLSPAFQLAPGPAGPLGTDRGIRVCVGSHRYQGTSFP